MTLFIFVNDKLSRTVDTAFDWLLKFKNNLTTNPKSRSDRIRHYKQQATARKIYLKKNNRRCQVFERLNRD